MSNTLSKPTTTKPTTTKPSNSHAAKVLKVLTRIKAGPSCRRC